MNESGQQREQRPSGQNQVWTFDEEVQLFRVIVLSDTSNFLLLSQKFEGRTRKQVENKWQNIKRKSDAGVVEWKTVLYAAVRHFFEQNQHVRDAMRSPLADVLDGVNQYTVKQRNFIPRLQARLHALKAAHCAPLTCGPDNDSRSQCEPRPSAPELQDDQVQALVDQIILLINL